MPRLRQEHAERETTTTRGVNFFFSLFMAAREDPSPARRSPSIQTTAFEASGREAPFLISATRPDTLPADAEGERGSRVRRKRSRRIIQFGENHSIGSRAVPALAGSGDRVEIPRSKIRIGGADDRQTRRDLREGHVTLHDRGP